MIKLARLIHHRDVLGQMISILGGGPPATDPSHEILDRARPSNQNILFPRRVLQRKAEW